MSIPSGPSSPTLSPTQVFQQISSDFYLERNFRSWAGCLAHGNYFGYELASIGDSYEALGITSLLGNGNPQGTNTTALLPELWTGGFLPPLENSWAWTDGYFFNTSLWAPTEPNSDGTCVFLNNAGQLEDENCKEKHFCLYRGKYTYSPSTSTVPSVSPSTTTSPTTTFKPSETSKPSNMPSFTASPTTTFRPTTGWTIGTTEVQFGAGFNPQMIFSNKIGKDAVHIRIQVLSYSCFSEVGDNVILLDSSTIMFRGNTKLARYAVELDRTKESNNLSFFNNADTINNLNFEFCTKLELLDADYVSLASSCQRFFLSIAQSVGFNSLSFNIEQQTPDGFDFISTDIFNFGDIEFFSIIICQCQSDFTCSSSTVEQDTKVGICLKTSATVVEINYFDLFVAGDGATGFGYQPVIVENEVSEGLFGTTIETQGRITKINFPLVTGFFDDGADSIVISGNAELRFVNSSNDRRLMIAFDTNSTEQTADKAFELRLDIGPPKAGCFYILMTKLKNLF